MNAPNSSAWWLMPLVAIGISLELGSDGYAQNRRGSTNRPLSGKAPDQATSSKSARDAIGKDELADDDTVKEKRATRSATKKKSAGSSKSARGKSSTRARAGGAMSESSTTVTAGTSGGLNFSGEL
jgi:hypothetical protein